MPKRLPHPAHGSAWPRIRNQGAAGPEVAHIVEVLEGQVMYRTDAPEGVAS